MGAWTFIFHGLNMTKNEYETMRKTFTDLCQKSYEKKQLGEQDINGGKKKMLNHWTGCAMYQNEINCTS
jgi:hypothetical protein